MNISLPKSVVLEVTYNCNHKCLFCSCPWFAPNSKYPKGEELTLVQWQNTILKLYELGVKTFSISGGEALLNPNLEQILRFIRVKGLERGLNNPIVLISNGLLMSEKWLDLFKELDVYLSMSLPGYTTFQEHTGVNNADGVLYWFSVAKQKGINTTLNVTVTKKNYRELFKTISLGIINGANSVLLNRFLPGGRGLKYMNELMISSEQLNGMLDTTEEVLALANRRGNVGTEIAICAINNPDKYEHLSIGYMCAAAKYFFVVGPSGEIRTCNHSPKIVGNIFSEPIIQDTDYWNSFLTSNYKPVFCNSCKKIQQCDCGCREVANILTGDIKAADSSLELSNHLSKLYNTQQ